MAMKAADRKGVGVLLLLGWLLFAMLNVMVLVYGYDPALGVAAAIVAVAMGIAEVWDRWLE